MLLSIVSTSLFVLFCIYVYVRGYRIVIEFNTIKDDTDEFLPFNITIFDLWYIENGDQRVVDGAIFSFEYSHTNIYIGIDNIKYRKILTREELYKMGYSDKFIDENIKQGKIKVSYEDGNEVIDSIAGLYD